MKKIVVLAIAIVLATTAFTALAAETTFNGEYRVRAWNEYNFDKKVEDISAPFILPGHENAQYDGWFDQRFRLTITHTRSEFLKAVIKFDLVEDTWGQQRNLLINNSAAGNFIDWAYIEFTLPTLGTFTVGKFPMQFGYGLMLSIGQDETPGIEGIKWSNAWGPVALSAYYLKGTDNITSGSGNPWYNWDTDIYAMDVKITPMEDHLIELFGGVMFDNNADTNAPFSGILWNSTTYWWNGDGEYSAVVGFWGLAYTGNIADMIDIKLENSWLYGHATYISSFPTDGPGAFADPDSFTIYGWNVYADVSYYNDLFRLGLAFLMGSGQHHYWNDISLTNVNINYLMGDGFKWANILGSWGGLNSVYNGAMGVGWPTAENLTSVKLYFEICPVEKLSLNLAVVWAKWTEDVGENFAGTRAALVTAKGPGYPHPASLYGNYWYQSWDAGDDLGWELDFGFSYEIMEGLTYSLSAGVLFTGDSWDYEKADGTRGDWGEIWSITNQLLYEF
ncbi:MAG: hypothetical protein JW984_02745 [Deltaproteobacteria bacterium]|uniref:Alginate export domain-containing protein n=1 Tax=Candidatus Zymogenus saltonus TaxID=2844893 RepID=A0A9D8KAJ3_9DELT|nr:hypothetical protein [Candidatus Zymogenus saltonus]